MRPKDLTRARKDRGHTVDARCVDRPYSNRGEDSPVLHKLYDGSGRLTMGVK